MKLMNLLLASLCVLTIGNAQDEMESKKREKMEMLAVWKLTEHLELTAEQGEKFFPRFREHEAEKKNIREQQKAIYKQLKEKDENSQSDVDAAMNQLVALEKQMIDARQSFVTGMKDILSAEQQLKLLTFQGEFMKEMRGRLKDHKGRGKKNRGMKRGHDRRF